MDITAKKMLQNFSNEIYGFEYQKIIQEFSKIFILQCGRLEYDSIQKRISNSNTFTKMNANSRLNFTWVNEKSIIGPLLLIPHFMFKVDFSIFSKFIRSGKMESRSK